MFFSNILIIFYLISDNGGIGQPLLDPTQTAPPIQVAQTQVVTAIPPPVFVHQPASGAPHLTTQMAPPQMVHNHIAPPQIITPQTAPPQIAPPQIASSQMTPQIAPPQLALSQNPPPLVGSPHQQTPQVVQSHIGPPHVASPQVPPPQIPPPQTVPPIQPHLVQSAVAPPPINALAQQHASTALVITPQVVQAVPPIAATQAVMAQPVTELLQTSAPTHQVVHLNPATIAQPPPSQQLVQTSSGPQIVQLPPGTQIVNTAEGPRLVAIQTTNSLPSSVVHHTLAAQPPPISSVPEAQPVPQAIENVSLQEQVVTSEGAHIANGHTNVANQSNGSVQLSSVALMMPTTVITTSAGSLVSLSSANANLEVTFSQSLQEPRVQPSVLPPTGVLPPGSGIALHGNNTVNASLNNSSHSTVNTSNYNTVYSTPAIDNITSEHSAQAAQQYYYNPGHTSVPSYVPNVQNAPPSSGPSHVYAGPPNEQGQALLHEQSTTLLASQNLSSQGQDNRKEIVTSEALLRPPVSEPNYAYESAAGETTVYHLAVNKPLDSNNQPPLYQQVIYIYIVFIS